MTMTRDSFEKQPVTTPKPHSISRAAGRATLKSPKKNSF